MSTKVASLLGAALAAFAIPAAAGDRLIATGGAQTVEGTAGGGIVPWAVIAGYGTRDQVGGSAFCTRVSPDDFDLDACGVAAGIFNRVELSFARQKLDAGSVIPGLKLRMDTTGVKVRLFGDAVYEQDSLLPQVSAGAMYKRNLDMTIPSAIGARRSSDTDFYLSATKVWLAGLAGRNAVGTLTLRATRANQLGLLGFGGDRKDSYSLMPEISAAVLLTDNIALGGEYRWKPDNLRAFKEDDFGDVFLAWFVNRHVAVTLAYAKLGSIAGKSSQDGAYLSLQLTY
jgi:hypothetical protein